MKLKKTITTISLSLLLSSAAFAQDMVSAEAQKGLEKSVRYTVEMFTDTRDRKLEDVLKKMPGLSNEWGSEFSYNGMDVEKIYVNGQDILGDNYAIVYNMKPEDVEYVEIIENHVTQKVMKGIQYSNDAAMNVVLKNNAKTGWAGSVKAGAGILPTLYNLDFNALNLGSDITNSVLLKADNTGLNLTGEDSGGWGGGGNWGLPQFLNVSPSLAPLSDQRVRFNNSLLGTLGSNIRLSDDYSLNVKVSYDTDKIKASSLDETTYYLDGGESVVDVTGEDAVSKQRKLEAVVTLLSNTEKKFLQNTTQFSSTWRDVDKDITGSFPSDQGIRTTPMEFQNELEFKLPLGRNILSIDSEVELRTRPEHLNISREEYQFAQNIDSRAADVDLYATYSMNFGNLNAAIKAGGAGYSRKIATKMSGAAEMEDSQNESVLNSFMAQVEGTLTYITDDLQIEASVPLRWGSYNLRDLVGEDNKKGTKLYFSPSLSAKYQLSDEFALTARLNSNQDEVNRGDMYPGVIFKDFRSATRGIPSIRGDKSQEAELGFTYRRAKSSLFLSGSIGRTWSQPAFIDVMDFSENYIISGFEEAPEGYKDVMTMMNADISKGINALKGKIGLGIFGMSSTSSMIRNGAVIPYKFRSIGLRPNINGRIFPWCNVIYSIDIDWDSMKMDKDETSSSSKGYTQNLEIIFSPWQKFNFSLLGEHYYTEFTDDMAKHLVLTDFKAEYTINPKWVIMAAVTNILNQKTYNYTLVDSEDFTKSFTSYNIRPRNVLISLYHKF
ncbi:MAG: TonB-dependent receptor [Bacteroidales bacterium]|nr:TonB-dependent receptor [Bacteroidales bacterium]